MIVIGLDPGTDLSAVVFWNGREVYSHAIAPNEAVLTDYMLHAKTLAHVLALEKVESFGMAVGKDVFPTVFWSGRFAQAWTPQPFVEVTRREDK